MSHHRFRIVPVIVVFTLLAGCTSSSGAGRGGLLGGGTASSSGLYITALQGGIVGRSGVQLSSSERQRALEAEYRALEAAAGGQPISWTGGKVSGEVVANAPYQVGSQNCRQYTHKVISDGREIAARGAACRNANGTWTPLT